MRPPNSHSKHTRALTFENFASTCAEGTVPGCHPIYTVNILNIPGHNSGFKEICRYWQMQVLANRMRQMQVLANRMGQICQYLRGRTPSPDAAQINLYSNILGH
jgi:hypothetical protein